MSINSYLKALGSALVIRDNEKESINRSVETLIFRANNYFDGFEGCRVFGSYTRDTILPRKADNRSDVDIMMVFNNGNSFMPQTYLNWVKKFAEKYYPASIVHQDRPSVALSMQHIRFEMTPGKPYAGIEGWYNIPFDSSTWQVTKPNAFNDRLVQCNSNNGFKIKPIVRLMKHWNVSNNYRDMASFELEGMLVDELMCKYFSCTSYTEYLLASFGVIRWKTSSSRVADAIAAINDAVAYENNGYPNAAMDCIQSVFPEV